MNKNGDKIFFILFILVTILVAIIETLLGLSVIIKKDRRITDLESKVEDLEKQSKEVHEYILNRIGG